MPRKSHNSDTTPVLWPISRLRPHPRQAGLFRDLPDEELAELAQDIEKNGQRVPVEVKPDGTIISGHQRVRALKQLGRLEVWVVVRADLDGDEEAVERRLIEDNLHRRQLDPLGRARCFQRLLELERERRPGGLGQRERGELRDRVASRLGLSGRNVTRYLAVLRLPMPLQDAFSAGKLTLVEAAALAGLGREKRERIGEAAARGEDLRELLSQQAPGRRWRRGVRGGDLDAVDLVGYLRRWLARLGGRLDGAPLSDEDLAVLSEARAVIDRLLRGTKRSSGGRGQAMGKAAEAGPDTVSGMVMNNTN